MLFSPQKWFVSLVGAVLLCGLAQAAWAANPSTPTRATRPTQADPAPVPPTHGRVQLKNSANRTAVRRASWPLTSWGPTPRAAFDPRQQRIPAGYMVPGGTVVSEPVPEEIIDAPPPDAEFSTAVPDDFGGGYGDPGDCGGMCGGMCGQPDNCGSLCIPMCCLPVPCISFRHLSFEFGVQGFKGPMNGSVIPPIAGIPIATDGSFGFHYGLNWGMPLPFLACHGVGLQLGAGLTHSNLEGSLTPDLDRRNQFFATFGAFRRVAWGLQGGFVFDYYREDWYVQTNMWQVRGELSWIHPCNHEFGVTFATNLQNDVDDLTGTAWTTTDYYTLFYRRRFDPCGGAEGRIFAGTTGEADGLLGVDAHLPLNDCWALDTGFSYLIPTEGRSLAGVVNESWNIAITLVWYPNGRAQTAKRTCFEPLFGVANNGNLFVDVNR